MPEVVNRPTVVSVAYWLWLVAAVLLILFGLLALTYPSEQLRASLESPGRNTAAIDSILTILRGSGVIAVVVGLGLGFLAGPVRRGDERFRRALVSLSIMFGLITILAILTVLPFPELLLVAILLFGACALVYRPAAKPWFAHAD